MSRQNFNKMKEEEVKWSEDYEKKQKLRARGWRGSRKIIKNLL